MIQTWIPSEIRVITSLCKYTTSSLHYENSKNHSISHNSVNIQDKRMKILSQCHLKLLDAMIKVLQKISSHHGMIT